MPLTHDQLNRLGVPGPLHAAAAEHPSFVKLSVAADAAMTGGYPLLQQFIQQLLQDLPEIIALFGSSGAKRQAADPFLFTLKLTPVGAVFRPPPATPLLLDGVLTFKSRDFLPLPRCPRPWRRIPAACVPCPVAPTLLRPRRCCVCAFTQKQNEHVVQNDLSAVATVR